jgi:uncharacterized protein YukE
MGYGFVADAEKMQELHNDLVNTANEITAFIEDIYTKVDDLNTVWSGSSYDSFKAKCESYRISLDQLPQILNAFAVDMGTLGGNANTMVVSLKALLDCSDVTVRDGAAGTRTVQTTTRKKDASGAYVPDLNTFDSKITIPSDTNVGTECWACAEVGDPLYLDAIRIKGEVDSELAMLQAYKSENAAAIAKLPQAQRDAINKYLTDEINKRTAVSDKIADATYGDFWKADGDLFNATSVGLTGNQVVGWTQQSSADAAVKCAQGINNDLSKMSDFSDIEAYMMDCGLGTIGG